MTLKKAVSLFGLIAFVAVIIFATASCNNEEGESYKPQNLMAITTVAIRDITAPVSGGTPDTTASGTGNFSVSRVSWSPDHFSFFNETEYTVSVTLTANQGYTFTGLNSATINGRKAVILYADKYESAVSYTFPATSRKTVVDIYIETQPHKLTYWHGESLDLTGLGVMLIYNDASSEYVSYMDFPFKNITTNPSQGEELSYEMHNGCPITITYGGFTLQTIYNLYVMPEINDLLIDPIPDQIYTGYQIIPEVTVKKDTTILRKGIDYNVSYGNNFYAGTAVVIITGINRYSGSYGNITFNILQTVPQNRIEYYWIDQHDSLVTTSGGATTIVFGETLTITARDTSYDVKQWHLDGISTGQSGNSYIFPGIAPGTHTVGLFVEKDGKLYNTNIAITIVFRVTFHVNGGTGTPPASQMVTAGSDISLPDGSGFARGSYSFCGWNVYSSNSGSFLESGSSYIPKDNVTLYAQWRSIITYDINGGTGTTPDLRMVTTDSNSASSIIYISNGYGFSKTGYYFNGWNTKADGTGNNYDAGSTYTPTGSITLYANWSRTPPVNGGTEANPFQLTADVWTNGNITSSTSGGAVWYWFKRDRRNYILCLVERQQGWQR